MTELRYHDYLALVAFLDDSEFCRVGNTLGDRFCDTVGDHFTHECCRYRDGLLRDAQDYFRGEGLGEKAGLASYLYNPACFVAFGFTDALGITLIDDFDALLSITSSFESTADEVSIAFCPVTESLGLPISETKYLRELHELFSSSSPARTSPSGTYEIATHDFELETPLISVTRFKVMGTLLLGQGLLVQRALFRAMARKITQSLDALKAYQPRKGDKRLFDAPAERDFWFAFADTQGSSEVALIVGCRNFTIAAYVVDQLMSLALDDLYVTEPELVKRSAEFPLLSRVASFGSAQSVKSQRVSKNAGGTLPHNHVFANGYTTLCVSREEYKTAEKDGSNCSGYVIAHASLDINPGHLHSAEADILRSFNAESSQLSEAICKKKNIHLYEVGRNDLSVRLESCESLLGRDIQATHITTYFSLSRRFVNVFRKQAEDNCESDALDIHTTLTIPIPRIDQRDTTHTTAPNLLSPHAHSAVTPMLISLKRQIRSEDPLHPGRFQAAILQQSLQRLGLPEQLKHSILNIYQNFGNCLGDPQLFDNVLDLYDALATFYRDITVALPVESARLIGSRDKRFFGKAEINRIAKFVETMSNALSHRMAGPRPKSERRDVAIEFRGGLNQILSGTDVVMKCGLGLLKWWANELHAKVRSGRGRHDRVGAVSRLSMYSHTTCQRLMLSRSFKTEPESCLAMVEINVGELFHPFEYVKYFHEAAHLILEAVDGPSVEHMAMIKAIGDPEFAKVFNDRVSECYVGYLTLEFVMAGNTHLFLKYHLSSFSSDPSCTHWEDIETIKQFAEFVIRAFMIVDPLRDSGDLWEGDSQLPSKEDLHSATMRFRKLLTEVAPFYVHFERLFSGRNGKGNLDHLVEYFEQQFCKTVVVLREEWYRTREIYSEYVADRMPWRNHSSEHDAVICDITTCLEAGNAMIGDRLTFNSLRGFLKQPYSKIDELAFVCEMLYAYVEMCFFDFDDSKAFHLSLGKDDRLDYKSKEHWNSIQLAPGHAGLKCADPNRRRQRMRWSIIMQKKLWDISTDMRGRRMTEIIDDHYVDLMSNRFRKRPDNC